MEYETLISQAPVEGEGEETPATPETGEEGEKKEEETSDSGL